LSFTEIERLIRDPYAIYARHVLRLRKLDALNPGPDARIRGRVFHDIFDRFMTEWRDDDLSDPHAHLIRLAEQEIARSSHWPVASRMLMARINEVAPWFIEEEIKRQGNRSFLVSEIKGETTFSELSFTLHGRADRIDRLPDGSLLILDYKSGAPPSEKDMTFFDVQLLLEALLAEAGGFDSLEAARVSEVGHIGLGRPPKRAKHSLEDTEKRQFSTASIGARFVKLIEAYNNRGRGYTSRRAMQKVGFAGDYDHLARFGEWDDSAEPEGREVG
jgi:RecB family exonuclease